MREEKIREKQQIKKPQWPYEVVGNALKGTQTFTAVLLDFQILDGQLSDLCISDLRI